MRHRALRDDDLTARTRLISIVAWNSPLVLVGAFLGLPTGVAMPVAALVFGVPLVVMASGITLLVTESAGLATRSLFSPAGPQRSRKGLSAYDAMVAGGQLLEARRALEAAWAADQTDPRIAYALAHVLQDHLHQYDDAALWFGRVARCPGVSADVQMQALRELVELCENALDDPLRALPALGAASTLEHPKISGWARAELVRLRATQRGVSDQSGK